MNKVDWPSWSPWQGVGDCPFRIATLPRIGWILFGFLNSITSRHPWYFSGNITWFLFGLSLQVLIVKSILMIVQVTLVSMESVWMELIVIVVPAHQDSQVMLLFVGRFHFQSHYFGKRASKVTLLLKCLPFLCILEDQMFVSVFLWPSFLLTSLPKL